MSQKVDTAFGASRRFAVIALTVMALITGTGCAAQSPGDEPAASALPADVTPVIIPAEGALETPLPKEVAAVNDSVQVYLDQIGQSDLLFSLAFDEGEFHIVTVSEPSAGVRAHIEKTVHEAGVGLVWATSGGLARSEFVDVVSEFGRGGGGKAPAVESVGLRRDGHTVQIEVYDVDSDPAYYEGLRKELEEALQPSTITVGIVRTGDPDSPGFQSTPPGDSPFLGQWQSVEHGEKHVLVFRERGRGSVTEVCNKAGLRWSLDGSDRVSIRTQGGTLKDCMDDSVPHWPYGPGYAVLDGDTLTVFDADDTPVDVLVRS